MLFSDNCYNVSMAKILIIDDDIDILQLLATIAKRSGHEISFVQSTQEALTLIRETNFALIMLDLMMPEYDGYDFLKLYKTTYPDRKSAIVVITADKSKEAQIKVMNLGARHIIHKPITNQLSLLRMIESYCHE